MYLQISNREKYKINDLPITDVYKTCIGLNTLLAVV